MKTAIHNTQTNTTTIRDIPKWHPLPEYYILLQVIRNDRPVINPATYRAVDEWQLDLVAKTYTQVWSEVALTEYEIAMRDWTHPEYEFRIVCPKQLGEQYPAMYVHFQMEELPIEKPPTDDNLRRIYINTILQQHSDLLESLADVVDVEHIPTQIENYD